MQRGRKPFINSSGYVPKRVVLSLSLLFRFVEVLPILVLRFATSVVFKLWCPHSILLVFYTSITILDCVPH